jgi:3'(2'), 5'-bisphosphate nucleotidase
MHNKISIEAIIQIAIEAGKATLEIYEQDFEVIKKTDDSPLTLADQKSNAVIIEGLKALEIGGDLPIISEETKLLPYSERKDWTYFWLIDPLDGNKRIHQKEW